MKNNVQRRVLSLLAVEKKGGKPILQSAYIREKLDISNAQMCQTKRILLIKGYLEDSPEGTLVLKGKYAFRESTGDCFSHKVCSFLTVKNGRSCYCCIKHKFIDEKHYKTMCGCLPNINYSEPLKGMYYRPLCPGWNKRGGDSDGGCAPEIDTEPFIGDEEDLLLKESLILRDNISDAKKDNRVNFERSE